MSILLEALRKTEQQQRPAPTIHDQEPQGSAPEPRLTWPMVVMIAVALFISGWAAWQQYKAPEGVYRPPVTLAPGQVSSSGPQAAQTDSGEPQPGKPVTQTTQTDTGAPKPAKPATRPASEAPKTQAESPARQQRTPVEMYLPPASASSAETGTVGGEANRPATAAGSTADSADAAATRNQEPSGARRPAAAVAQKPDEPHIPEPIGYWELPDAIRANVPEIKFSVLVYNDDPKQRFVLINGERLAEGDIPLPGLKVEEIRRDGVVFSYRLYRFLVGR